MHDREQKAAEEKKRKAEAPIVRSEAEQKKYDEEQAKTEKESEKKKEDKPAKVKIRPLSEAKAIELGANFFSEAFIFAVAAGLLVWDSWRSRAKESARRDDVAERLGELETEVERLRGRYEPELQALRESVKPLQKTYGWYNPAGWFTKSEPVPAEGEEPPLIPGNVPGPAEKVVKPSTTGSPPETAAKAKEPPKPQSESRKGAERPADRPVDKTPEHVVTVAAAKKER